MVIVDVDSYVMCDGNFILDFEEDVYSSITLILRV